MKRVMSVLVVLAVLAAGAAPMCFAEETGAAASTNPAKDVANYTTGVVTGSVNTVGEAAKETTETAVSPIVALWRSMIGKGSPKSIVTDPINKGGKTVYNATVNTGKTIVGEKK